MASRISAIMSFGVIFYPLGVELETDFVASEIDCGTNENKRVSAQLGILPQGNTGKNVGKIPTHSKRIASCMTCDLDEISNS